MENVHIEYSINLPDVPKTLGDWGNKQINGIVSVVEFIELINKEMNNVIDITTIKLPDMDELRQNDFPCIVFNYDNDEYILSFYYNSLNSVLMISLMENTGSDVMIITNFVVSMDFMESIELLDTFETYDPVYDELIHYISGIIEQVISNWELQKIEM